MQTTGPRSGPFRSERGSAIAGVTLAVSVLAAVGFYVTPESSTLERRDDVRIDAAGETARESGFVAAALVRRPEIVSAPDAAEVLAGGPPAPRSS